MLPLQSGVPGPWDVLGEQWALEDHGHHSRGLLTVVSRADARPVLGPTGDVLASGQVLGGCWFPFSGCSHPLLRPLFPAWDHELLAPANHLESLSLGTRPLPGTRKCLELILLLNRALRNEFGFRMVLCAGETEVCLQTGAKPFHTPPLSPRKPRLYLTQGPSFPSRPKAWEFSPRHSEAQ